MDCYYFSPVAELGELSRDTDCFVIIKVPLVSLDHSGSAHWTGSAGVFSVSQEEFSNVCVCIGSSSGEAEILIVILLWKVSLRDCKVELLHLLKPFP